MINIKITKILLNLVNILSDVTKIDKKKLYKRYILKNSLKTINKIHNKIYIKNITNVQKNFSKIELIFEKVVIDGKIYYQDNNNNLYKRIYGTNDTQFYKIKN